MGFRRMEREPKMRLTIGCEKIMIYLDWGSKIGSGQ